MQTLLAKSIFSVVLIAALLFGLKYLIDRIANAEGALQAANAVAASIEAENAKLLVQIKEMDKASAQDHSDEQGAILRNFENVINQERTENERIKITANNWRTGYDLMRDQVRTLTERLSQGGDGLDPSGSGENSNTTCIRQSDIEAFEDAVALTTSDYNRCKKLLDESCILTKGCIDLAPKH